MQIGTGCLISQGIYDGVWVICADAELHVPCEYVLHGVKRGRSSVWTTLQHTQNVKKSKKEISD